MRYRIMTVSLIVMVIATVCQISLVSAASINPSKKMCDLTVNQSAGQVFSGDTYLIPNDVNTVNGDGNYSYVQPGDRLLIPSSRTTPITFKNLKGEEGDQIVIMNDGGKVRINANGNWAGIQLCNCEHIRLTGTGDSSVEYGFEIYNSTGCGVIAYDKTRYVEIDHIEIHDADNAGMYAKTDDEELQGVWTQYDTYIHHNYIHDVGKEGLYLGRYDGGIYPSLEGVEICHNRIERTGWDGIQVANAVAEVKVHHNTVVEPARGMEQFQNSGLLIGAGTVGDWYDNIVINANDDGLYLDAKGAAQEPVRIYNNIFVNAGAADHPEWIPAAMTGYWRDTVIVYIYNNTIVNSNGYGIHISGSSEGSSVYDNIVTGSRLTHIRNESTNIKVYNNLEADSVNDVGFADPDSNDFRLFPRSPATDAGSDTGFAPFDFDGVARPLGERSDIGAFEFGD